MKVTKKMYEEYLNAQGVPEHEKYENGGRYRGQKYGSWLRRNHKACFDQGYEDYVQDHTCTESSDACIEESKSSQTLAIKDIETILQKEQMQQDCKLVVPDPTHMNHHEGIKPLVIIESELESSFIKEFIKESLPKDKYLLKPCSVYELGVYPLVG